MSPWAFSVAAVVKMMKYMIAFDANIPVTTSVRHSVSSCFVAPRRCARFRPIARSSSTSCAAWPFSFAKGYLWEDGTRAPAIVRWPGVILPGQVTEQAAITMDWTATILAATGTAPDPAYPLDGEDLLPVCSGKRPAYDRTLFWRVAQYDAARIGRWKYLKESGREHLFDLSIDPGEKADRRAAHADTFEQIQRQYLAWSAQMLPKAT